MCSIMGIQVLVAISVMSVYIKRLKLVCKKFIVIEFCFFFLVFVFVFSLFFFWLSAKVCPFSSKHTQTQFVLFLMNVYNQRENSMCNESLYDHFVPQNMRVWAKVCICVPQRRWRLKKGNKC